MLFVLKVINKIYMIYIEVACEVGELTYSLVITCHRCDPNTSGSAIMV